MRPIPLYVVLDGDSKSETLTPSEVAAIFDFAFRVHNHEASTPAQPLFWVRTHAQEIWRFAN